MPFTNYPFGVRSYGSPMLPSAWGKPMGFGGKGNITGSAASTITAGPGSQIFFVNSAVATASDAAVSNGLDPFRPFKTINFAVTRCIANNGDVIFVGPGHVETVASAAAFTVGKAGVSIIGCGNDNSDRPQINYTTSTAATVTITAASTWISGINFVNAIDARVDGIIISAADCRLYDCDFFDGTGTSSLISIRTTNAGVRLRLYDIRCYFGENTGTARTEFLRIVGGTDHEIVSFYNNPAATFSTAVINNVTTASTGIVLADVYAQNGTTAPAAVFVSTTSGLCIDRCDFVSTGVSAITLPNAGNYSIDGDTAITTPIHQATAIQGSTGAFQKSFTSSSITTSDQTWVTCTGGSVMIESGSVETDATGLAGMTNLVIDTNNANGTSPLFSQAITGLGANKTVALGAGATTATSFPFVLESTKVLQIKGTASGGTGGGKVFLNLTYRVLSGAPILS